MDALAVGHETMRCWPIVLFCLLAISMGCVTVPKDDPIDALHATLSVLEVVRDNPAQFGCKPEYLFTPRMLCKDMGRDYMVDWGVYGKGMRIGGTTKEFPVVAMVERDKMMYSVHTVTAETHDTWTGHLRRNWMGRWEAEKPFMRGMNSWRSVR